MKITKNWGLISSNSELYMMAHAERHRKIKERKHKRDDRKTAKRRLPKTLA